MYDVQCHNSISPPTEQHDLHVQSDFACLILVPIRSLNLVNMGWFDNMTPTLDWGDRSSLLAHVFYSVRVFSCGTKTRTCTFVYDVQCHNSISPPTEQHDLHVQSDFACLILVPIRSLNLVNMGWFDNMTPTLDWGEVYWHMYSTVCVYSTL